MPDPFINKQTLLMMLSKWLSPMKHSFQWQMHSRLAYGFSQLPCTELRENTSTVLKQVMKATAILAILSLAAFEGCHKKTIDIKPPAPEVTKAPATTPVPTPPAVSTEKPAPVIATPPGSTPPTDTAPPAPTSAPPPAK